MKIGLLSFADCNNYGDQYFAPICRAELAAYLPQAEFDLITPTGTPVEGDTYIAYEPAKIDGQYAALLVVGVGRVELAGRIAPAADLFDVLAFGRGDHHGVVWFLVRFPLKLNRLVVHFFTCPFRPRTGST